jgi:hypothetical protein
MFFCRDTQCQNFPAEESPRRASRHLELLARVKTAQNRGSLQQGKYRWSRPILLSGDPVTVRGHPFTASEGTEQEANNREKGSYAVKHANF